MVRARLERRGATDGQVPETGLRRPGRLGDLEGSIDFYSKLFATEPAKLRPGYANFAITEPALKLVLLEGEPGQATVIDHLASRSSPPTRSARPANASPARAWETLTEDNITCCYAVQDKVWVHGPGQEPWEVYTVKADWQIFSTDSAALATPATCCTPDAETGQVDEATQPEGCCS